MLERMVHRGACSCDNITGDGAGLMVAMPHEYFTKTLKYVGRLFILLHLLALGI